MTEWTLLDDLASNHIRAAHLRYAQAVDLHYKPDGALDRAEILFVHPLFEGDYHDEDGRHIDPRRMVARGDAASSVEALIFGLANVDETKPMAHPTTGERHTPSLSIGKQLPPHPVQEEQRDTFDRYKDVSA